MEVWSGSQKLKTILASKTKAEKDIFLWNYTGVLIQTGEWRNFHSFEETWTVLASFWGMKAPAVVPTAPPGPLSMMRTDPLGRAPIQRYHRYLDSIRKSALTVPSDPDVGTTDPATPYAATQTTDHPGSPGIPCGSYLESTSSPRLGLSLDHYE